MPKWSWWPGSRRPTAPAGLMFVTTLANRAKVYSDQKVREAGPDGVVFACGARVDGWGNITGSAQGTIEVRGPGHRLVRLVVSQGRINL